MTRQRGFTLIEMLVALVMLALITVATAYALTAGLRAQADMRRRADSADEARALLAIIARDLQAAYASADNPGAVFEIGRAHV